MKKVAINGLGRIGRMVFRIVLDSEELDLVAINATHPATTIAHLIKYDSTHGTYDKDVQVVGEDKISVDGKEITITSDRNPENLPWQDLGIDIVIKRPVHLTTETKHKLI